MYKFRKSDLYFKRGLDILISVTLLLLLIPLFIVISLFLKIDSRGPIFFKQARLSLNGKEFMILKFRTMIVNAEKTGAGLFNYSNDPRVTRFGDFLRNTSLDELPQLINVIKGDMSLVGPRPCVTYELGDYETLNRRYKRRFSVLPGITGYAQIKGRNEITWDEKVNLDNEYIDLFIKRGILIDLLILVKTFSSVFKRNSIYEDKISGIIDDQESAKMQEIEIIRRAHQEE
ncbi:sugar transferase [Lacrimispora aerotolerans]|uniref:sugar transferase n=1 Tax=Lacrimispora aerotolerans TaxID=36832 RepID=UPI0004794D55|nr:sugar transferase [Lacrimispora aerotolerans]